MLKSDFVTEFWKRVVKLPGDGCWIWIAGRVSGGYGECWVDGKNKRASRASWEMHFGKIPKGKFVLHTCDNPPCVRPDHLYLGTRKQNAEDRKKRGNYAGLCGEKSPLSKLTEAQVREIRQLRSDGVPYSAITKMFSVSMTCACQAATGRRWAHLDTPVVDSPSAPKPDAPRRRFLYRALGESNPGAKLTEAQVREIRALWDAGVSRREIRSKYGVSAMVVWKIGKRKAWQHLG